MTKPAKPWDEGLLTLDQQQDREEGWLAARAGTAVVTGAADPLPKFLLMPGWQAVTVTLHGRSSTCLVPDAVGGVFPVRLAPYPGIDLTEVLDRLHRYLYPAYPVIATEEFLGLIRSDAARASMERPGRYDDELHEEYSDLDLVQRAGGVCGKTISEDRCALVLAHGGTVTVAYSTWQDLDIPDLTTPTHRALIESNQAIREFHRANNVWQEASRSVRISAEDKQAACELNDAASRKNQEAHERWRAEQAKEVAEQKRMEQSLAAEVRALIRISSDRLFPTC